MKKKRNKWIAIALICTLVLSNFSMLSVQAKKEEYNGVEVRNETPILKVGIVSDAQSMPGESRGIVSYRKALNLLKEKKIDLLLDAGDVSETGTGNPMVWQEYMDVFTGVYEDEDTRPEYLITMGNHDYYGNGTPEEHREKFNEIFGKEETNEHRVINGYHFLNITSYDSTSQYTQDDLEWLDSEIQKAIETAPELPVFVLGHPHAADTVYGSTTGWGNYQLNDVLDKYEQVIYLSGHSHYPLDDERSIYQKNYTAIGTASMNYLEMEPGKDQGIHPDGVYEDAEIMYMEIFKDRVVFERINLEREEKLKEDWVLSLPLSKETFTYTDERAEKREAPVFEENAKIEVKSVSSSSCNVEFPQAVHSDFTHSYRIKAINKETGKTERNFLIFSDFYNGVSNMKPRLTYNVTGLKGNTTYEIQISGIESFGKEGEPILTEITTSDPMLLDVIFESGNFKDYSKYNTKTVNHGNPVVQMDESIGKYVMSFDGESYVNMKLSDEQLVGTTGGYTFETVFKLNSLGRTQDVFGNGESAGVCLEVTPGGNAQFWTWSESAEGYIKTDTQVEADKYYHYIVTYDGKEITVYLDGKKVDTASMTGSLLHPTNVDMSLGVDPTVDGGNQGCFLDGNIVMLKMEGSPISGVDAYERYMKYTTGEELDKQNTILDIGFDGEEIQDNSGFATDITLGGEASVSYDEYLKQNVLTLDGESYAFLNVNEYQIGRITDSFTVESIFRLDELGKTQDIFANSEYGGICLEVTPSGNAQLWVYSADLGDYVTTDTKVEAGVYYHYQAVYDGEEIVVYLNGEETDKVEMTGSVKHPAAQTIPICIGGDPQTGHTARYLMSGVVGKLLYESDPIDEKEAQARYEKYEAQIHPQEPEELSTAVLEYAIGLAKDADITGVIDSVRTAFETALADAEQMLADVQNGAGGITQADVDASWQKLIKAMQYFSFKQGDKTDLEKVIVLATEIEGKLDSYMDDGKQNFVDMLAIARDTLADGNAMQDEVNKAWRGLLEAMANLRLKPDKSALESLINEASALSEEAYEAESFGVMRTALAKAQEVFADETADQKAVTAAEENLKDAVAKLVPVSEGEKADKNDTIKATADKQANATGTTATTTKANANNTAKSAKTGDAGEPMTAAAMMAIAMAAVAVLWKKRR